MFNKAINFLTLFTIFIILSACGGGGGSSTTVTLVVDSGLDQTVNAGATVNLSAINTTVTGSTIASYSWTQISGQLVTINNAGFVAASFTAPVQTSQNAMRFQVDVTTASGLTLSDQIDITVRRGVSLSGTITPSTGSRLDSDVNDPAYTYVNNGSISNAQQIANPVTLGGFVSVAGTGVSRDRFSSQPDMSDFYSVQLAVGQVINLSIADQNMDLDLHLLDQTGGTIAASLNPAHGVSESITVPGSFSGVQNFFVEVRAANGINNQVYSNYVLTIGITGSSLSVPHEYKLSSEFVPGELIVRFNDKILPAGVQQDSLAMRANSIGLQAVAGAPGRDMLMSVGSTTQSASAMNALGVRPAAKAVNAKLQSKLDTLLMLKGVAQRRDVKQARLNYIYQPLAIPNDTFYSSQWHYPLVNLPQAWDVTQGSSSVIVAVVDTGVLLNHPDFVNADTSSQLVQGYDFIRDVTVANDGNGIDNNPNDVGDRALGFSSSFHGSHVAGTIGAATNNATGVTGVGWNTRIMPMRVLGVGGGTSYDVEQAVRYAARLSNDSNTLPAQKADIINLSLGGPGGGATPQAYTDARNAGVIIVAAAGNESSSTLFYPASYSGVVSVSAVDLNKNLAFYSNFGSTIDIAAPGGDASQNLNGDSYPDGILSTQGSDFSSPLQFTYGIKQGTSMAAPHVAGIVALMKSEYPAMTPVIFDTILQSGVMTEDLGVAGLDQNYGYGLIDALDAVLEARRLASGGAVLANPFLAASPGSLNFGSTGVTAILDVRNAGTGILTVTGVTEDSGSWLSITPSSVDADNLGSYTVSVNRGVLPTTSATYTADITIVSSSNTVIVPVIMQVSSASTFDDVGLQYISLVDTTLSAGSSVISQFPTTSVNGTYTYTFNPVAPGTYQILSGSDIDNDFTLCDAGESCGLYLSGTPSQATFNVTTDMSNLDFVTGFTTGLSGAVAPLVQGVKRNPDKDVTKTIAP